MVDISKYQYDTADPYDKNMLDILTAMGFNKAALVINARNIIKMKIRSCSMAFSLCIVLGVIFIAIACPLWFMGESSTKFMLLAKIFALGAALSFAPTIIYKAVASHLHDLGLAFLVEPDKMIKLSKAGHGDAAIEAFIRHETCEIVYPRLLAPFLFVLGVARMLGFLA